MLIKQIASMVLSLLFMLTGCSSNSQPSTPTPVSPSPPAGQTLLANKPDHVVVVVEENHAASEIIGDKALPYMNTLAAQGALFTQSHAVEHPSEPNYLDLFSGTNQGVTNDSCPHTFTTPNLASELLTAHLTFVGYSEDLPDTGSSVCSNGSYARKHSPWVNFSNVPASVNLPLTKFPSDYSQLPTVSFVIPNLDHDMHDGTPAQADAWLKQNIAPYAEWAQTHNSLLIVTWDEDDNSSSNRVPTFFVGSVVKPGRYDEPINHYNVLRTLEDLYALPHAGQSANVQPIKDVWKS